MDEGASASFLSSFRLRPRPGWWARLPAGRGIAWNVSNRIRPVGHGLIPARVDQSS